MAQNDNLNQDQNQGQDPFAHPIKNNNWWLYIFGGIVFVGLIIWFLIDWHYKDRPRDTEQDQIEQVIKQEQKDAPVQDLPSMTEPVPQHPDGQ